MFKKYFYIILFFVSFGFPGTANSTVVIDKVFGDTQWGIIQFDHFGGDLTIDIFADGFTGGPLGIGIDDPYLTLRLDDGSPLSSFTGSLIAVNDDSNPAESIDESTSWLDSLLVLPNLSENSYLLAIGQCCLIFTNTGEASGVFGFNQDFQITFSTDVFITALNGVSVVPEGNQSRAIDVVEPASLAIFGLGLFGLGFSRKRRP